MEKIDTIFDIDFKREKNIYRYHTPAYYGFIEFARIDNLFHIEKQDLKVSKTLDFSWNNTSSHMEFNFPLSGTIELDMDNKYMKSKGTNDTLSFAAFENSKNSIYIESGQHIKQLSFNLNPSLCYKELDFIGVFKKQNLNLYKISSQDNFVKESILDIWDMDYSSSLGLKEIQFHLYQVMGYSLNLLSGNKPYYSCITKSDLQLVKQIRNYIEKSFLERLSLDNISKVIGSNQFKIKKAYKEVYNETIFETIRKKRMEYALSLILQNKYTLEQISYMCSYESYPSFYKAFQKQYNQSPQSYLKKSI